MCFLSLEIKCMADHSDIQVILSHPKLFSHTDHCSWSSDGALELSAPEAFLSFVLFQHSPTAFPLGNMVRAFMALGGPVTF